MRETPPSGPSTAVDRTLDEERLEADAGLERARSVVSTGAKNGSLAIGAGVLLLWRALRGVRRGRLRAVVQAALGLVVLRAGLRQRRSARGDSPSAGERAIPDEPVVDREGDEDAKVSDEAHAARHRPDHGREPETGPGGSVDEEPTLPGDESAPEPAADVDLEAPSGDPRTDDEEVDVSETALADEPGEATGPSEEQAQPTRTDEAEQDLASAPDEESAADSRTDEGASDGDGERDRSE